MKRIEKPNADVDLETIIDNCISHMNLPRRDRIKTVKNILVNKNIEYDGLAQAGQLYTIEEHDMVNSIAKKEDMLAAYNEKFVPAKYENRVYYDRLMHLAPRGICPYCQQNPVKTLDHFLPKSKYVSYTISPYNLVPACSDCNTDKRAETFDSYEKQPFHPYYDDFDLDVWLVADLVPNKEITFQFFANPSSSLDKKTRERIINSFSEEHGFGLNNIYKIHAAELYATYERRIRILYEKGGKELAIERLLENIEDERASNLNSWKAAMFQAMIDSDWYWEEYMPTLIAGIN